jgi:hypothetical protein
MYLGECEVRRGDSFVKLWGGPIVDGAAQYLHGLPFGSLGGGIGLDVVLPRDERWGGNHYALDTTCVQGGERGEGVGLEADP